MAVEKTYRGFEIVNFTDHNGVSCSLQQSSAIDFSIEGADDTPGISFVWLGRDVPEDARMHLSVEQVKDLVSHLSKWIEIGSFEEEDELFLLQNCTAGFVGNSPLFWRTNDSGYTPWIGEAKRFTKEEAEAVIKSTRGTHQWTMWPLDDVEAAAKSTVDIQDLRKVPHCSMA